MDMNEQKPATPADGKSAGNRSRHGRRRPHHHGRKNKGNQNEGQVVTAQNETASTPVETNEASAPKSAPAKDTKNTEVEAKGQGRPNPPRQQRVPHPMRRSQPTELPSMNDLLIEDAPAELPAHLNDEIDQAEVDRLLERSIFEAPADAIPDTIPEGKTVIVGVRFRAGGKTYFFTPGELTCAVGQYAIVETARGMEFGQIYIANRMVDASLVVPPLRPVVRIATEEDINQNRLNHEREEEAFRIGQEKINEHKLDMKLVSVQYTFDNSKLLFYFTSAGRVDFRELVKDLAGVFHIRIELRQIGIRDEARMLGGLGPCGRPLCCATFLSDFGQVSMKMAKEQNLSLNSTKISGCCGRLMCCLRYEHETYVEEIKRTPAPGTFVNTPDGPGVVVESLPLLGQVKVNLRNQPDAPAKKFGRDQVTVQPGRSRDDHRAAATTAEDSEPDSDE